MADDPVDGPDPEEIPREQRRRFQRLGEQITGFLDPESALRRGQGLVAGVTQATKEELVRVVSAEMRNFLDGMDAADLLQQVIAGLTIDVSMQVKFSRDDDGRAQPNITRQEAKIRREGESRAGRERNGEAHEEASERPSGKAPSGKAPSGKTPSGK